MGKSTSNGKTIYIRKGETKDDAVKRYEGKIKRPTSNLNEIKRNASPLELYGIERLTKFFGKTGEEAKNISKSPYVKEPVKFSRDNNGQINFEFTTIEYLSYEKSATLRVGDTPARERVRKYSGALLKGEQSKGTFLYKGINSSGKTISETTVKGKVYYNREKRTWEKIKK